MQVALTLLLVTLAVELIGAIGNDAIGSAIFNLVNLFRGSSAGDAEFAGLKKEVFGLRAELKATSSQDQFAKWAKIRRNLDKKLAQLDAHKTTVTASKAQFTASLGKLIWVATTVFPFILSSYHRKAAVFYLPPGWFGPAGWWMGLPSAPAGAVACGIWTMAIKRTVGAVKDVVRGIAYKEAKVAVAVGEEGKEGEKVPVGVASEKVSQKEEL